MRALTEKQAAEAIGWSVGKIKRLQLSGQLPFYPGRPPLVDLADLQALKVTKCQALPNSKQTTPASTTCAGQSQARQESQDAASNSAFVRRMWVRHRSSLASGSR